MQPTAKKKRIRLVEQSTARFLGVGRQESDYAGADETYRHASVQPGRTTVTVSTVLEAEAVRVAVDDRGYGVPQDSMDRIWKSSIASHAMDRRKMKSPLARTVFVKEVIEQHGGKQLPSNQK